LSEIDHANETNTILDVLLDEKCWGADWVQYLMISERITS